MALPIYDPKQLKIGRVFPMIGLHLRSLDILRILSWTDVLPIIAGFFWFVFPCFSHYHWVNSLWNLWGAFIHYRDDHWSTEYHQASLGIFRSSGTVWRHLWCRWITITRSPVKGRTQHVGKLKALAMANAEIKSICWTLSNVWCGHGPMWRKTATQSFVRVNSVNANSYKRIETGLWYFSIWVS